MAGLGRFRLPALLRDTASTMAAEALVLVGGLAFYALAARYFDPSGVGIIALVKRASGLVLPVVFLGLQTGLPRCIAAARAAGSAPGPYVLVGTGILTAALSLALLPVLVLPGLTARILMGDAALAYLALPIALSLASVVAYGAVRGFYFGFLRIPRANVIQVAAVAVAPLVALLVWHPTPAFVLVATGLATALVALAGGLPLLGHVRAPAPAGELRTAAVELIKYSTPRMPGDLAIAALMSAGTLWAARFGDLHTVGYLSISQSLLSAVTAAFIPLSVVVLPRAAALVAMKQVEQIRARLRTLVRLTLVGSLFVSLQGIVFADTVLYWWLGPQFVGGAPLLRAILLGVPFLALFFSLRGLVDAATARPYHTYNLAVALAVMVVGLVFSTLVLPGPLRSVGIAAAGSVALVVLAVLTTRVCGRLYDVPLGLHGSLTPLALCGGAAVIAQLVHLRLAGTTVPGLLAIAGLEIALAAVAVSPTYLSAVGPALFPSRAQR